MNQLTLAHRRYGEILSVDIRDTGKHFIMRKVVSATSECDQDNLDESEKQQFYLHSSSPLVFVAGSKELFENINLEQPKILH